jgi:hypothetical protein
LCHRLSNATQEMAKIAESLFGNEAVDQLQEYQQAQPTTND